jgi:hypothetical protein
MQDTGRFTMTGKSVDSVSEAWQGVTTCESLAYKSACKSAAKDACDCDPGLQGTQNVGGISNGLRTALIAGAAGGVAVVCMLAVVRTWMVAHSKKHPKKVQQLGTSFSKSARRFAKDVSTRATLVWKRMPGSIKEMNPYSMYPEDGHEPFESRLPSNATIPFTTNAQGAPDNADAMSTCSINTAYPPMSHLSSTANSICSDDQAHDIRSFSDGNVHNHGHVLEAGSTVHSQNISALTHGNTRDHNNIPISRVSSSNSATDSNVHALNTGLHPHQNIHHDANGQFNMVGYI